MLFVRDYRNEGVRLTQPVLWTTVTIHRATPWGGSMTDASRIVPVMVRWDEPRPGLVRPVRLDPTGRDGPTRGQARNRRRWRRSSSGFYLPAHVGTDNVEQRILEASVVLRPFQAVTGWAALRWLGGAWFSGTDPGGARLPVDLLISTHDIRPQRGFVVCGEGAGQHDMLAVDGVRVTRPAWSVVFMMRYAPTVLAAVQALDMAAYSDLASVAEIAEVVGQQSSWTGVPQAREALSLGEENVWSPQETRLRLYWKAAFEEARPRPNLPLFDLAGRHIGTPDVIDVATGVAADYDGVVHLDREQRRSDRTRDEAFASHGIEMVRWLTGDRPTDFLSRLQRAYGAALRRTGPRSWTADPPAWWTSTSTVDARRALTADQRERWLRYRTA